jgi:hypothetical protein
MTYYSNSWECAALDSQICTMISERLHSSTTLARSPILCILLETNSGGMTNAAYHRVKKLILCTLKYEVPQAHEVHAAPHIENILVARHTWKLIEPLNA